VPFGLVTYVYAVPTWLSVAVALAVIAGGSAFVHWELHRRGWRGFREHNDIVGFILTIVGAIYAVVLGFVAVVVWEQYEGARQNEQREVNALTALYELAQAYPGPARDALRRDITTYVRLVTDDEWPAMRAGRQSPAAARAALSIYDRTIGIQSQSNGNVASQTLSLAQALIDDRGQRLQDNRSGIPILLWVALLGGGIITIGFGYLFGIENERFHATATACVAAIIAIMLVLIARLDYPYRGDTGIPPTDWEVALHAMAAPR
jgi:hypothetical protein